MEKAMHMMRKRIWEHRLMEEIVYSYQPSAVSCQQESGEKGLGNNEMTPMENGHQALANKRRKRLTAEDAEGHRDNGYLRGEEDGDFYTEVSERRAQTRRREAGLKTSATEKKEEKNPHPQNRRTRLSQVKAEPASAPDQ
jgi:hypothetical protein